MADANTEQIQRARIARPFKTGRIHWSPDLDALSRQIEKLNET